MAHPQHSDATQKLELAQIFRRHSAGFCAEHPLSTVQQRALRAIEACRTAQLGGHLEQCDACGTQRYLYHYCRNRHCPKCQTRSKERWLGERQAELLPVPYFHVVFTLPHQLNALAQGNPAQIYRLLFESASRTLLEFGHNPRWLGGEIAATLVLHTWGQNLSQHLHMHCLVSGGALAASGQWLRPRRGFLFPVKALSAVFRGKFLHGLNQAFDSSTLNLAAGTAALADVRARVQFFTALRAHPWVVYAKQPFAAPEQVLQYLGRYTHRVALTNNRLVSATDQQVCFRYKDYAHGNRRRLMRLVPGEFIRRFLLHVLPKGFMRIRHYGLIGNRGKYDKLARARLALHAPPPRPPASPTESVEAFWQRVAAIDIHQCPRCLRGRMLRIATLAPRAHGPP